MCAYANLRLAGAAGPGNGVFILNILVTGIGGFIGSHVARHLIDRRHAVVGLDDLSGGFEHNIPEGAQFELGSIGDREFTGRLFEEHRFDAVYHLAAYAAEGLSHFIKRFNYENNLVGSANLLAHAVNYETKLFVFTSSIAVYGAGQLPMREDLAPDPEDPYGIAKLAFERELRVTGRMFGLPYVIFRPHNVYGEGQNVADRFRNVVGIFMRQALRGEAMTVFGDGLQTRAFSHIDDVAPLIAEVVDRTDCWNEVFNIGADQPYTVLEIAEAVGRALGVEPRIRHLEARNEVMHAYADHSKLRRFFGERPLTPLEQGIGRMTEHVRRHGIPHPTPAPPIEIPRNLPEGWDASA